MQLSFRSDPNILVWLIRLLDLLIPPLVLILIHRLFVPQADWFPPHTLLLGTLLGLLYVFFAQTQGLYRQWLERSLLANGRILTQAWLIAAFAGYLLHHLIQTLYPVQLDIPLAQLIAWLLLTPIILVAYRQAVYRLTLYYRNLAGNQTKVAIFGAGDIGQQLAERLQDAPWLGYQLLGFIDDNPELHHSHIARLPVLGDSQHLDTLSRQRKIDELYICLPLSAENKIKHLLNQLADTTVVVKFVPDLFAYDLMHTRFTNLKGLPVFSVYDSPLNAHSLKLIKRLEDILLSSLMLILLAPLMLLIALLVKLSGRGPVIFKQKRYGLNGNEINVYKFRTMHVLENHGTIRQATRNDPRITPLGRWLRKTSLDELPQIINVLQGRMSLVGPRPHASAHNEQYRKLVPRYMQRHMIKPGITGWAQVNGWRGETDTLEKMQKRIEFDLHYINNWSLWLDIKILILTLAKGLTGKNVY